MAQIPQGHPVRRLWNKHFAPALLLPLLLTLSVTAAKVPANGKLKVFILASQSNMVGFGQVKGDAPGTMQTCVKEEPEKYGHLVDADGKLLVRDDVWLVGVSKDEKKGWLTTGFGASAEPARDAIYHWFNMNDILPRTDRLRIYAFDADFKRYAPDSRYPKGRFFDRRSDPEEVAGERGEALGWGHYFHAGLDLDKLTDEQRKAWDELGKVLEAKKEVPVTALAIETEKNELKVGGKITLAAAIKPTNATRNNVVWVFSNPEVARIEKFGEVTALKPGEVEIRVYSWQDARPLGNGKKPEFKTDGIQAKHRLKITN